MRYTTPMVGIIFALLCAVFIGLSQIALRKSYKELPPSIAFAFDAIFGLLIWVPLAVYMGVSLRANLWEALVFAFISAILSEAIVFYALSHGELAVTATVLATYPVYTIVFSRLLNKEVLSLEVALFVIIAIMGSVIASLPDTVRKKDLRVNKAIAWPFIAAICIGLSDTISKGYINKSGDFSFLFMLGFIQIPVGLAYLKIEKQPLLRSIDAVFKQFNNYTFALLGGLCNIIGTGFLWLSFSYAPASIASPITGSSGALTVIFSKLLLKENISKRKYFGIILAFIGILGITFFRNG